MEELGNRDLPVVAGDLDEIAMVLAGPEAIDLTGTVDDGVDFDIRTVEALAETDWDPSSRNQHLRAVAIEVGKMESIMHDYREPKKSGTPGSKISRQEGKASRSLAKACARCALEGSCEIAGSLPKWHGLHRAEAGRRLDRYGEESRARLLKRLKEDPKASCLPPKKRS